MDHSQYQYAHPNTYTYSQYAPPPPGAAPQQHHPDPYAQPQQYPQAPQQPQQPPHIRNPFAPPPRSVVGAQQSQQYGGAANQNADYDPEYQAQLAQWQSAYAPQPDPQQQQQQNAGGPGRKNDNKPGNANLTTLGARRGLPNTPTTTFPSTATTIESGPLGPDGKPLPSTSDPASTTTVDPEERKKTHTVVRTGGGETWTDSSLLDWDPTHFRIMVGNLAGEVTDDSLAKAFAAYSPSKARVVRDKRTTKSRGYGFVAFADGELGFKAAREMVGKYIGSHPVTIQRAKTVVKPVAQREAGGKKHGGKGGRHDGGNGGGEGKDRAGKNAGAKKKADDVLKAHTGSGVEKKGKNDKKYKMLG